MAGIKPDKPLVWLQGEIKTPPFSAQARIEAGVLLRRLQRGEHISMPHARPMPTIGRACHELRVRDTNQTWRIVYCIQPDAIVIVHVFAKTTARTPKEIVEVCRERLRRYAGT